MERREFIKLLSYGTASLFLAEDVYSGNTHEKCDRLLHILLSNKKPRGRKGVSVKSNKGDNGRSLDITFGNCSINVGYYHGQRETSSIGLREDIQSLSITVEENSIKKRFYDCEIRYVSNIAHVFDKDGSLKFGTLETLNIYEKQKPYIYINDKHKNYKKAQQEYDAILGRILNKLIE